MRPRATKPPTIPPTTAPVLTPPGASGDELGVALAGDVVLVDVVDEEGG